MHTHLRLVAFGNIAVGALSALVGILLTFGLGLVGVASGDVGAAIAMGTVGLVIGVFLIILSLPQLVGGVGLLARKNWARYLLIVTSAFGLFAFPVGTVLAGYSLWVLTNDDTKLLTTG